MTSSTVTPDQALSYVGGGPGDLANVTRNLGTAAALCEHHCKDKNGVIVHVPVEVLNEAVLNVTAELFNRKNAKNGVLQFATPDSSPVRIARDPMVAGRPILDPFLPAGIA